MAKKTFHASHVELRHNTYFAVLYVPKDVRHIIGKTKFSRSTETGDLALAERRAAPYITGWKAQISRARNEPQDPIIAEAQDLFYNLKTTNSPYLVQHVIEERTSEIAQDSDSFYAEEFKKVATGKESVLSTLLDEWKANELAKGSKQKTIDQMVRDVKTLTDTFHVASSLTPEYTTAWLLTLGEEEEYSASSITRIVWACRNFFRYLQSIGEVPKDKLNPFNVPEEYKKSKKSKKNSKNRTESWVPFTAEEVVSIYREALKNGDQQLADLIEVGAYTGARIEELCSLKCKAVHLSKNYFNVYDSKTEAGIRSVPIHSKIRNLVKRLVEESQDGYLFSGLTFNKYGARSNAIGKKFGRLKTAMKFTKLHVFHSVRKTLTTQLENAGISENVAADIVGHEKPRITYGLYSGGASIEVKREAIEKVTYDF